MIMNINYSDEIHEKIDDYILGLLPPEEQTAVEELITKNSDHNKYYIEQKELIELSQSNDIPDPGPEFWQHFPDQILDSCKENQTDKPPNLWKSIIEWWNNKPLQSRILQPVVALTLLIAVFTLVHQTSETSTYSPLADQQLIWKNTQLTSDTLQQLLPTHINRYAFSSIDSINMFSAGQHYSLSIAYFFKHEYSESSGQIQSLKNLNIKKTLNTLDNHLNDKNINTDLIFGLYKSINTELKHKLTANDYALFAAGSWLTGIQIALVTKQYHLFNALNHTTSILNQLKSQELPQSVYKNLEELNLYLNKNQHSRKDLREIKQLISNIQSILT